MAAGLTAQYLMQYLFLCEENSSEIINKIRNEFMDEIQEIRYLSEAVVYLSAAILFLRRFNACAKRQYLNVCGII